MQILYFVYHNFTIMCVNTQCTKISYTLLLVVCEFADNFQDVSYQVQRNCVWCNNVHANISHHQNVIHIIPHICEHTKCIKTIHIINNNKNCEVTKSWHTKVFSWCLMLSISSAPEVYCIVCMTYLILVHWGYRVALDIISV